MSSSNGVLGEDLISLRNASQLLPQPLVFGCENVETGDLYLALWAWVMFSLALWINLWRRVPPVILFLYDMVGWVQLQEQWFLARSHILLIWRSLDQTLNPVPITT